jgi:hypothetical protein
VIPRWQWLVIILLLLAAVSLGVETAPNSYAYLFLNGRCLGANVPTACHYRLRGGPSRWGQ